MTQISTRNLTALPRLEFVLFPSGRGHLIVIDYYRGIPSELESCTIEPAFKTDEVTFCIWQPYAKSQWSHNQIELPQDDDSDGSAALLTPLDGQPETYWWLAGDHYEQHIPPVP